MVRWLLVGVACLLVAGLFAGSVSSATTTLGSTNASIGCAPGGWTSTQVGSGSGYVVPSGSWTITSWSVNGGTLGGSVSLRVYRPLGGGSYLIADGSNSQALSIGTTSTFPESIHVQGGDLVGLGMTSVAECANFTGDGSDIVTEFGSSTIGATVSPVGTFPGYQLDLSVTLSNGGSPAPPVWVAPPATAGYCSVAGNTNPFSGAAIPPGTFLYLFYNQPETDSHYSGATPALYIEGKGITCDPPPAGYTQQGYAGNAQHVPDGLYPYYAPPPS